LQSGGEFEHYLMIEGSASDKQSLRINGRGFSLIARVAAG
jgi:hypothetical protein